MLLVLTFCVSYFNYRRLRIDNKHRKAFYDILLQTVESGQDFNMAEITPFAWDKMFIVKPYTTQKEAFKQVNVKWTTTSTYPGYILEKYFLGEYQLLADEIHKLVFLKEDEVILDIDLMRWEADFTKNESVIFAKEAFFTIIKENSRPMILKNDGL